MEFTVKGDLFIEPDGAFLLEGGKAHLRLFEKSGLRDSFGELIKRGMNSKICLTGDTIRRIDIVPDVLKIKTTIAVKQNL